MHFGLFIEEARPGQTQALAFRDVLELADAAEAYGLDGVWLGEIHFNPGRSVISAQMVMAAAIASRTRRQLLTGVDCRRQVPCGHDRAR